MIDRSLFEAVSVIGSAGDPRRRSWMPTAAIVAGVAANVLLLVGLSELSREQREANLWLPYSLEILEHAARVEADQAIATSEGLGFLLNPSAQRQIRFDVTLVTLNVDLAAVSMLTADNPVQQAALVQLGSTIGTAKTRARASREHAPNTAERIHALLAGMKTGERRLLLERSRDAKVGSRRTLAAFLVAAWL